MRPFHTLSIQQTPTRVARPSCTPAVTSGKLQGVWLRSLVVSILWLWALRALSFFDQLIFTFSVFEIEVDVFDHLQLLLGLSSEVTIFNLRHTLLGLSSEILNIITFTV